MSAFGTCPTCGKPFDGVALVDGVVDGKPAGWAEGVCSACEAAKYPYRDDPRGRQLRQARLDARLTFREAAARLGIDFVQLSKIECGRAAPPHPEVLARWLEALR